MFALQNMETKTLYEEDLIKLKAYFFILLKIFRTYDVFRI